MGPCRSCWNGTSALQPEEITLKGTINKSAHMKKSGNLFNDPCKSLCQFQHFVLKIK